MAAYDGEQRQQPDASAGGGFGGKFRQQQIEPVGGRRVCGGLVGTHHAGADHARHMNVRILRAHGFAPAPVENVAFMAAAVRHADHGFAGGAQRGNMTEQRGGSLRHGRVFGVETGEQGAAETDGEFAFVGDDAAICGHAVVFHAGNEVQGLHRHMGVALVAHAFQGLEHGIGLRAGAGKAHAHGFGGEGPAHGQAETGLRGGLHGAQRRRPADVAASVGNQKNASFHALSGENVSSVKSWKPFLRSSAAKSPSPSTRVWVNVPS